MSTNVINDNTVLAALSSHIGKGKGIQIETLVWEACHLEPNQARQRKARTIVCQLREQGHHICAHPSHGYYMAANDAELDETCQFLHDRAMTSLRQVARMKKVSIPDLRGQLKLLK